MSGKQAKAKRKSAKKAAESSAPERPRTDFVIENVRCFAGEHRVPIRPITLLVGENSTGKTTFLGCLHAAINLAFPSHKNLAGNGAGFNAPPFSMGGFGEIARRVGGDAPEDEFRFGFADPRLDAGDLSSMAFSFKEIDGEASAAKFRMIFPSGEVFEISKEKSERCVVSGPDFRLRGDFPTGMNFSLATAVTIALFLAASDEKSGTKPERKKAVRFLSKIGLPISNFGPKEVISGLSEGAKIMSKPFRGGFRSGPLQAEADLQRFGRRGGGRKRESRCFHVSLVPQGAGRVARLAEALGRIRQGVRNVFRLQCRASRRALRGRFSSGCEIAGNEIQSRRCRLRCQPNFPDAD